MRRSELGGDSFDLGKQAFHDRFTFRNGFCGAVKIEQVNMRQVRRYEYVCGVASQSAAGNAILEDIDRIGDGIKQAWRFFLIIGGWKNRARIFACCLLDCR